MDREREETKAHSTEVSRKSYSTERQSDVQVVAVEEPRTGSQTDRSSVLPEGMETKDIVQSLDMLLDEMDKVSGSLSDAGGSSREDLDLLQPDVSSRKESSSSLSDEGKEDLSDGNHYGSPTVQFVRDNTGDFDDLGEIETKMGPSNIDELPDLLPVSLTDDGGAEQAALPSSSRTRSQLESEYRTLSQIPEEDSSTSLSELTKGVIKEGDSQDIGSTWVPKPSERFPGVVMRMRTTPSFRKDSSSSTGDEGSTRSSLETVILRQASGESSTSRRASIFDQWKMIQPYFPDADEEKIPVENILKIWKRRSRLSEGSWSSLDMNDLTDEELEPKRASGLEGRRTSRNSCPRVSALSEEDDLHRLDVRLESPIKRLSRQLADMGEVDDMKAIMRKRDSFKLVNGKV